MVAPFDGVLTWSSWGVLSGGLPEEVGRASAEEVVEEVFVRGSVEETVEVLFVEVSVPLTVVKLVGKDRVDDDETNVVDVGEGVDVVLGP